MKCVERALFAAAAFIAACAASPAGATMLVRAELEELVADNRTIVVGEVRDVRSYWNKDRTFILSDVRVATREVVKGDPKEKEITVTLMGGTVGGRTVLIVAGPDLQPGKSYVLFLDRGNLPGAPAVRFLRDHAQGVFDVVGSGNDVRAVNQASRHPLASDALGRTDAPGGPQGLPLNTLIGSIKQIAARQASRAREVQR
jgi:hypothetical protein